jgi:hypothetical protein
MENLKGTTKNRVWLSALCLSALFFLLAQSDAPQSQLSSIQTRLSSGVWTAFDNYETLTNEAVEYWKNQNTLSTISLNSSEEERLTLERHFNDMTNSVYTLSEESKSLRKSVEQWMKKYYKALIPLIVLSALCVLNWIGKGFMFVLWIKGIPVPRWLDILI